MQNRFLPYGYEITNGNLTIVNAEMRIVQRIFADYCNGSSIEKIGRELTQEGIVFYNGNYDWNKCRVSRILSDKRYLGESGFPQIIDEDTFVTANKKKDGYKSEKHYVSEYIECLRKYVACAECGKIMKRRATTSTVPKWYCRNSCKKKIGITDDRIVQGIAKCVARAVANRELINAQQDNAHRVSTPELTQCNGEINLLMNEKQPSFAIGKQLILRSAELKFLACKENLSIYTDKVIAEVERIADSGAIDSAFITNAVQKVMVEKNGGITVKFINGAEIGESDNADNG